MKKIIILFLFSYTFLFAQDLKVIGVVSYIEGELTHEYDLSYLKKIGELKKGDMIYTNSIITITNSGKSVVELITTDGIYTISKFPVKNFTGFNQLNKTEILQIKSVIAGNMIKEESVPIKFKLSDKYKDKKVIKTDIFNWDTKIGAITENEIKEEGLKLILNKKESSFENKKYNPLKFKLNDKFDFDTIDYEIYDNAGNFITDGTLANDNDGYIFNFDSFKYYFSSYYHVIFIFNLKNDKISIYDFYYKVISNEDLNKIEEDINKQNADNKNNFLKEIVRVFIYDQYALYNKKNILMIKLGIRLD